MELNNTRRNSNYNQKKKVEMRNGEEDDIAIQNEKYGKTARKNPR